MSRRQRGAALLLVMWLILLLSGLVAGYAAAAYRIDAGQRPGPQHGLSEAARVEYASRLLDQIRRGAGRRTGAATGSRSTAHRSTSQCAASRQDRPE
jgi:hypothetical protein